MPEASEQREQCAALLLGSVARTSQSHAFLGFDGFVDEIGHVVDKRTDANTFSRVGTIADLAARIQGASGHSTNIEVVNQQTKLGGNGPIMANALARLGVKVTYLGALGYPNLHPVFNEFAERAAVHSIAEAGHTDALEFRDGKVMLTKTTQLNDITWQNIQDRFGRDRFIQHFSTAQLVGFVNWTMIPHMNRLWSHLLSEITPSPSHPPRRIFFDLADPAKRTRTDIIEALQLIQRFSAHFDVILGLNEKEAVSIASVLDIPAPGNSPDSLCELALALARNTGINNVVVHPVTWALAVTGNALSRVQGPTITKPLITTGAGDHFNAGFCLAKLLGLDNLHCLLAGVATSGFYVKHAKTPGVEELARFLRNWPQSD